jgi:hypothetical protein
LRKRTPIKVNQFVEQMQIIRGNQWLGGKKNLE